MISIPKIPEGTSLDDFLAEGVAIGLIEITIEAQPKYKSKSKEIKT